MPRNQNNSFPSFGGPYRGIDMTADATDLPPGVSRDGRNLTCEDVGLIRSRMGLIELAGSRVREPRIFLAGQAGAGLYTPPGTIPPIPQWDRHPPGGTGALKLSATYISTEDFRVTPDMHCEVSFLIDASGLPAGVTISSYNWQWAWNGTGLPSADQSGSSTSQSHIYTFYDPSAFQVRVWGTGSDSVEYSTNLPIVLNHGSDVLFTGVSITLDPSTGLEVDPSNTQSINFDLDESNLPSGVSIASSAWDYVCIDLDQPSADYTNPSGTTANHAYTAAEVPSTTEWWVHCAATGDDAVVYNASSRVPIQEKSSDVGIRLVASQSYLTLTSEQTQEIDFTIDESSLASAITTYHWDYICEDTASKTSDTTTTTAYSSRTYSDSDPGKFWVCVWGTGANGTTYSADIPITIVAENQVTPGDNPEDVPPVTDPVNPSIAYFSAVPGNVDTAGDSSLLTWSVNDPFSTPVITGSDGSTQSVTPTGSMSVTVSAETTYTLTVNEQTATATVTVGAQAVSTLILTASSSTINSGEDLTLTGQVMLNGVAQMIVGATAVVRKKSRLSGDTDGVDTLSVVSESSPSFTATASYALPGGEETQYIEYEMEVTSGTYLGYKGQTVVAVIDGVVGGEGMEEGDTLLSLTYNETKITSGSSYTVTGTLYTITSGVPTATNWTGTILLTTDIGNIYGGELVYSTASSATASTTITLPDSENNKVVTVSGVGGSYEGATGILVTKGIFGITCPVKRVQTGKPFDINAFVDVDAFGGLPYTTVYLSAEYSPVLPIGTMWGNLSFVNANGNLGTTELIYDFDPEFAIDEQTVTITGMLLNNMTGDIVGQPSSIDIIVTRYDPTSISDGIKVRFGQVNDGASIESGDNLDMFIGLIEWPPGTDRDYSNYVGTQFSIEASAPGTGTLSETTHTMTSAGIDGQFFGARGIVEAYNGTYTVLTGPSEQDVTFTATVITGPLAGLKESVTITVKSAVLSVEIEEETADGVYSAPGDTITPYEVTAGDDDTYWRFRLKITAADSAFATDTVIAAEQFEARGLGGFCKPFFTAVESSGVYSQDSTSGTADSITVTASKWQGGDAGVVYIYGYLKSDVFSVPSASHVNTNPALDGEVPNASLRVSFSATPTSSTSSNSISQYFVSDPFIRIALMTTPYNNYPSDPVRWVSVQVAPQAMIPAYGTTAATRDTSYAGDVVVWAINSVSGDTVQVSLDSGVTYTDSVTISENASTEIDFSFDYDSTNGSIYMFLELDSTRNFAQTKVTVAMIKPVIVIGSTTKRVTRGTAFTINATIGDGVGNTVDFTGTLDMALTGAHASDSLSVATISMTNGTGSASVTISGGTGDYPGASIAVTHADWDSANINAVLYDKKIIFDNWWEFTSAAAIYRAISEKSLSISARDAGGALISGASDTVTFALNYGDPSDVLYDNGSPLTTASLSSGIWSTIDDVTINGGTGTDTGVTLTASASGYTPATLHMYVNSIGGGTGFRVQNPTGLFGGSDIDAYQDNLRHLWPLNDVSGTFEDVLRGVNLTKQDAGGYDYQAQGVFGDCVETDGTNTVYMQSSNPKIDETITCDGISFSMWFKPISFDASVQGYMYAALGLDNAGNNLYVDYHPATHATLHEDFRGRTDTVTTIQDGNYPEDNWYLVTQTSDFTDGSTSLHINGATAGTGVMTKNPLPTDWTWMKFDSAINLCETATNGICRFQQAVLWDTALSLAAHQDLYNNGAGRPFTVST